MVIGERAKRRTDSERRVAHVGHPDRRRQMRPRTENSARRRADAEPHDHRQ